MFKTYLEELAWETAIDIYGSKLSILVYGPPLSKRDLMKIPSYNRHFNVRGILDSKFDLYIFDSEYMHIDAERDFYRKGLTPNIGISIFWKERYISLDRSTKVSEEEQDQIKQLPVWKAIGADSFNFDFEY